jgi:para-aminobenzoate synthetase component I
VQLSCKTLNRKTLSNSRFPTKHFDKAKEKVLNYAKRFDTFCFLDNHQYAIPPHSQECLLAAGVRRELSAATGQAFFQLQEFIGEEKSWLFGHLGYDLKNEIEQAVSEKPDRIGFPDLYFFEPEILIRLNDREMIIDAVDPSTVYADLSTTGTESHSKGSTIETHQRFTREEYIRVIEQLKHHIRRGDCYEINFCQEFFAENTQIDPLLVYRQLSAVSPNPFSALYRCRDKWLICASPERFLAKKGNQLVSQPIKGTSKRDLRNEQVDRENRELLAGSSKDRSENVMVVDLVRNDLSRVCVEGSVKVDELFGIYSFPQVHQMISTVSGQLRKGVSIPGIFKACFPMGSMTGAPKKRVMELIEQYERTKRGVFSGALGYINPEGDFDFNVVIRSILYNSTERYLSFQAGSGITFYSDPANEWEECLMKAGAIKEVLTG